MNYRALLRKIINKHGNHPKWNESFFYKIKTISNTKVGSVGQEFLEAILENLNYKYKLPKLKNSSSWDIEVQSIKFEIKTATEDTSGSFQFNHIRYHRKYDAVLCLGIAPNDIYFGVWSKEAIATGKAGNLVTMEAKANASFKLTKKPETLFPVRKFKAVFEKFLKLKKAGDGY